MRRRSSLSLEVKHDRWLVSYADFVTLLFAFFVVMYSISQVNEGKYKVLSETLTAAFSVPQSSINPIQVGEPSRSVSPSAIEAGKPQPEELDQQSESPPDSDWMAIAEQVTQQFTDLIDDELLTVNSNELWLELELNSNILFPTASADASLQAKGIFEEIADLFSAYSNPVQVEGFTDNVPINNRRFSSNWELSAARAASIVKLLAANGVKPERLSAVGRGEFQPVADNETSDGRAKNRRVVVMISKKGGVRPQVNAEDANTIVGEDVYNDAINNELIDPVDSTLGLDNIENEIAQPSESIITPLELNDGGLLFTNDPELPRSNLTTPANSDTSDGVEETPVP